MELISLCDTTPATHFHLFLKNTLIGLMSLQVQYISQKTGFIPTKPGWAMHRSRLLWSSENTFRTLWAIDNLSNCCV